MKFGRFLVDGKPLEDVCPEHLSERLRLASETIQSFKRSFGRTGIKTPQDALHLLYPEHVLIEYNQVKSEIVEYVFENYSISDEKYEFYLKLSEVVDDIERNPIQISPINLLEKKGDPDFEKFLKKIKNQKSIKYDIFSSKTGRMGLRENSFPILNIKKEYREIVEPKNDLFVEVDYNAAELRTFLGLIGDYKQPQIDLHEWNRKKIFKNSTRDECKTKIFAWMFGQNFQNESLKNIYDKERLFENFWQDGSFCNPFGREIECDSDHFISYLIQSTFADLFLRKVCKVFKLLENYESRIAFFIHDSIIFDLKKSEKSDILMIVLEEMGSTSLGQFPVSVASGDNFGNLSERG